MDLGSGILAATGFITGVGALYVNWRSQKDQRAQQVAANRVSEDKTELERTKQIVDQLSTHNDRLIARSERAEGQVEDLRDELDEERTLRRHMLAAQESRCRDVQGSMVETLIVLRGVVNDEIMRAAADAAIEQPSHPHELPAPQRETEGETDGAGNRAGGQ